MATYSISIPLSAKNNKPINITIGPSQSGSVDVFITNDTGTGDFSSETVSISTSASGTITYTPHDMGNHVISLANSGPLVDPGPYNVTVLVDASKCGNFGDF